MIPRPLIDYDEIPAVRTIHTEFYSRYGYNWVTLLRADDIGAEYKRSVEAFFNTQVDNWNATKTTLVTAHIDSLRFASPSYRCVVIPRMEQHILNMRARSRSGGGPIFFDEELVNLRADYFRNAFYDGTPIFNTFSQALSFTADNPARVQNRSQRSTPALSTHQ